MTADGQAGPTPCPPPAPQSPSVGRMPATEKGRKWVEWDVEGRTESTVEQEVEEMIDQKRQPTLLVADL